MLDTSGVAWTRKNTWFQRGTTMLDTSGVAWTRKNTWFQPTRGGYLRCGRLGRGRAQDRPEAPGGQKVNESIADTNKLSTFRFAPQENPRRPMLDTPWVAWTRENTWFQHRTTMLRTPWVAWTRENTRFQRRTTMLDTPLSGLDT